MILSVHNSQQIKERDKILKMQYHCRGLICILILIDVLWRAVSRAPLKILSQDAN